MFNINEVEKAVADVYTEQKSAAEQIKTIKSDLDKTLEPLEETEETEQQLYDRLLIAYKQRNQVKTLKATHQDLYRHLQKIIEKFNNLKYTLANAIEGDPQILALLHKVATHGMEVDQLVNQMDSVRGVYVERDAKLNAKINELEQKYICCNTQRTFIKIEPAGVYHGFVSKIIKRFEVRGYKLVAMKMVSPLTESGPIVAMVWEGLDAVKQGRIMIGATNPLASAPGSIHGDFCIEAVRNICHGSDSVESANREISQWFRPDEIFDYKHNAQSLT